MLPSEVAACGGLRRRCGRAPARRPRRSRAPPRASAPPARSHRATPPPGEATPTPGPGRAGAPRTTASRAARSRTAPPAPRRAARPSIATLADLVGGKARRSPSPVRLPAQAAWSSRPPREGRCDRVRRRRVASSGSSSRSACEATRRTPRALRRRCSVSPSHERFDRPRVRRGDASASQAARVVLRAPRRSAVGTASPLPPDGEAAQPRPGRRGRRRRQVRHAAGRKIHRSRAVEPKRMPIERIFERDRSRTASPRGALRSHDDARHQARGCEFLGEI